MASSEFCMCSPLRWNNLKNHLYGWENPYHDRWCSDLASARFSSAHCMAKDMDDLYQPSHRGDCRQGNKLQGNEGKSVVMQLCGEVWWNQAHGNELVLAGGRLQTMIRGAGIMGYGGFNPCEKDRSMCILHCEAGFDGPGSRHIRGGTLPVLLHPSDGFVLVELPLEFVFLQGQHRHARWGWGGAFCSDKTILGCGGVSV